MFVCPKCGCQLLLMRQGGESVIEITRVSSIGVDYGHKIISKTICFFCKNCTFSLPCQNEKELVEYCQKQEMERQEKAIKRDTCLIIVKKCNDDEGFKFIIEYYCDYDDYNEGNVDYVQKARYAEELTNILFNRPRIEIQFIDE